MPGFNGTGPLSRGPFTGKGQGYCISQVGEGTGRGVGRGRRNCWNAAEKRSRASLAYASSSGEGGSQELDLLRERVKNLEAALELVTKKRDQIQVTD